MGCDIHMHTEVKVNGKWLHYGAPNVPRTYLLFALMADVRNVFGVAPISRPKGLPEDVSEITRMSAEKWDGDGHSHSWLSAEEIALLDARWTEEFTARQPGEWRDLEHHYFGYLEGTLWSGFTEYRRPRGIEDVRFVFWFDN